MASEHAHARANPRVAGLHGGAASDASPTRPGTDAPAAAAGAVGTAPSASPPVQRPTHPSLGGAAAGGVDAGSPTPPPPSNAWPSPGSPPAVHGHYAGLPYAMPAQYGAQYAGDVPLQYGPQYGAMGMLPVQQHGQYGFMATPGVAAHMSVMCGGGYGSPTAHGGHGVMVSSPVCD